jgi:hypothetical protein
VDGNGLFTITDAVNLFLPKITDNFLPWNSTVANFGADINEYRQAYRASRGNASLVNIKSANTVIVTGFRNGQECNKKNEILRENVGTGIIKKHSFDTSTFFNTYHYLRPPEKITDAVISQLVYETTYKCLCNKNTGRLEWFIVTKKRNYIELFKSVVEVEIHKTRVHQSDRLPYYPALGGIGSYGEPITPNLGKLERQNWYELINKSL